MIVGSGWAVDRCGVEDVFFVGINVVGKGR
jgi:hypothetical protein